MDSSAEQQPLDEETAVDPQLTQLVAYLDGELPPDASEQLENQLSADPPLRQQAEALDRAWQMLSLLEEVPASAEFVGRTLATIQTLPAAESSNSSSDTPPRRTTVFTRTRLTSLAAGLLLGLVSTAAGLSYARDFGLQHSPPDDLRILQQLELLRLYPQLRSIPDEAFLQELAAAAEVGGRP